MNNSQQSVLIVSATGTQGHPVVKLLLKKGFSVRILVRNPDSPSAQELIKAGAEPFKGDLSDSSSLEAALKGINTVYSILPIDFDDPDLELTGGLALIKAAVKAGVQQFVHSSVASAGTHESFPRWGEGYWNEKYWTIKWDIEEAVRKAGFPFWTILKPAFFMENLLPPLRDVLFPQLKERKLITVLKPEKKMNWVAVEDIAKFACAAFEDPDKFNHKSIEIASDSLTNAQTAKVMTKVLGKKFESVIVPSEEASEYGLNIIVIRVLELCNDTDVYHADFDILNQYDIPRTSLEQWLTNHLSQLNDILQ